MPPLAWSTPARALAVFAFLAGCARSPVTGDAAASTSAVAAPSAPQSAAPSGAPSAAPSTPSAPSGTCTGLAPTPCVRRRGCVLDQPGLGKLVCRDAKNACERAVLHADVIGAAVPGIEEAASERAERTCKDVPGCVVAGGKCSCPCAIFANCNCTCGGGYLRRCMPQAEASTLADFPPK